MQVPIGEECLVGGFLQSSNAAQGSGNICIRTWNFGCLPFSFSSTLSPSGSFVICFYFTQSSCHVWRNDAGHAATSRRGATRVVANGDASAENPSNLDELHVLHKRSPFMKAGPLTGLPI